MRAPSAVELLGPALLSASAGAVHLAVVPEHLGENHVLGELFLALGLAQLAWAAVATLRPRRVPAAAIASIAAAAAGANALVAVLWLLSRTAGLPPLIPAREAVGLLDVLATGCEVALVALLVPLLRGPAAAGPDRGGRTVDAGLAIGAGAVPMTVLALSLGLGGHEHGPGEASALVGLAHHGVHLMVLGLAFAAFSGYLAVFVRRNGRPGFAWRLRPRPQEG